MASLSHKIRERKIPPPKGPMETLPATPPPLTRGTQAPFDDTDFEEINIDEKFFGKTKLMFITDIPLSKKIRGIFEDLKHPIKEFQNKTFTNVGIATIDQKDIYMLWVNLRASGARDWVCKNAIHAKQTGWKMITVTTNGQADWVGDLEKYSNNVVDCQKLKKYLKTLTFEDFIQNLDSIDIHKVPNKLLSCLGLVCGKKKHK